MTSHTSQTLPASTQKQRLTFHFALACLLLVSWIFSTSALAQQPADYWRQLLTLTQEEANQRKINEEARLQLNQQASDAQAKALAEVKRQLAAAKAERQKLETAADQLEQQVQEARQHLAQRSSALGEVFAVFREEKSNLYGLLTSAFYSQDKPELLAFAQPSSDDRLPTINDFYQLWQSLQASWLATGELVKFNGKWINAAGEEETSQLTRLGDMQLLLPEGSLDLAGHLPALWPKQPSFMQKVNQEFLANQAAQGTEVVLDPARGQTFELLKRQPTLIERVHQGGFVGYVIIVLGIFGLLLALVQGIRLSWQQIKVKKQTKNLAELKTNNLLGKVLSGLTNAGDSFTANQQTGKQSQVQGLEAKLDELLIKEAAPLEKGLALVKLLAAMAPLLGLLGTVTGMIATFQAITLFGTGDPSLMASGISQALVTTVLGLVTAVPLLLAHLLLQGRSRSLTRLLESQSLAWLAEKLNPSVPATQTTKASNA